MVFVLTEQQKLLIIIIASSLFLLSVIITVCVVSPICLIHKWLFKSRKLKTPHPKQQIITQESKHFQLSVVPHYGSYNGNNIKSDKTNEKDKQINESKNLNNNEKINDIKEEKPETTGKIKMLAYLENIENVENKSTRLIIKIQEVTGLNTREHGLDPCCYVICEISCQGKFMSYQGAKFRRRSVKNKVAFTFQTNTAKRSLSPVFNEVFSTPDLSKNIVKDGCLKLKVYDEERYANDVCLGEITLPLKSLNKTHSKEFVTLNLNYPNEIKGELLIEMCYLPTSNRMTFSIIKATINNLTSFSPSKSYYIRILMFANGKLLKKKKSTMSMNLNWEKQENITFDLISGNKEEIAFMMVLAYKNQPPSNVNSSPSSPETPENELNNYSKKDKNIGHCIIAKQHWSILKQQPRKQIAKWLKLL